MTTGNERKSARLPATGRSEIARRYVSRPTLKFGPRVLALLALIEACRALEKAAWSELQEGS